MQRPCLLVAMNRIEFVERGKFAVVAPDQSPLIHLLGPCWPPDFRGCIWVAAFDREGKMVGIYELLSVGACADAEVLPITQKAGSR